MPQRMLTDQILCSALLGEAAVHLESVYLTLSWGRETGFGQHCDRHWVTALQIIIPSLGTSIFRKGCHEYHTHSRAHIHIILHHTSIIHILAHS